MTRYVFELPRVTFDREWRLGAVLFRPAGVVANEVLADDSQTKLHQSWAWAYKEAADTAVRWRDSATVEAEADSWRTAEAVIAEAIAVLRFLLREIVTVNVEIHRIGLVGEVGLAVRDHLVVFDTGRVGIGARVVDAPVDFRFTHEQLHKWDTDDRVKWLSAALAVADADRSLSQQCALTAVRVLDQAFLTQEPTVRIILYAVALEVLFSSSEDTSGSGKTSPLEIAKRVAFLTCGQGCAATAPACPYVLGFKSQSHLWTTAEHWADKGYEWRCSAFLDIARPSDMDPLFTRPSLFGARNQAVHEGRTTLDRSHMRWVRSYSERAVRAFLEWVTAKPLRTVTDLDAEIRAGVERWGIRQGTGPR